MEIVECMLDQVRTMEENLLKLKKGDVRVPVHRYILYTNITAETGIFFFRLELQRIKFMVNSYLRIRLQKIQNNIFYYANQHQDNPDRLTSKVDNHYSLQLAL